MRTKLASAIAIPALLLASMSTAAPGEHLQEFEALFAPVGYEAGSTSFQTSSNKNGAEVYTGAVMNILGQEILFDELILDRDGENLDVNGARVKISAGTEILEAEQFEISFNPELLDRKTFEMIESQSDLCALGNEHINARLEGVEAISSGSGEQLKMQASELDLKIFVTEQEGVCFLEYAFAARDAMYLTTEMAGKVEDFNIAGSSVASGMFPTADTGLTGRANMRLKNLELRPSLAADPITLRDMIYASSVDYDSFVDLAQAGMNEIIANLSEEKPGHEMLSGLDIDALWNAFTKTEFASVISLQDLKFSPAALGLHFPQEELIYNLTAEVVKDRDGSLKMMIEKDVDPMIKAGVHLELALGTASGLDLTDRQSLAMMLPVSLVSAEAMFDEKGVDDLVQAFTGASMVEMITPMPPFLTAQKAEILKGWLGRGMGAGNKAEVFIHPAAPTPVQSIAAMLAGDWATLGNFLNVSVD